MRPSGSGSTLVRCRKGDTQTWGSCVKMGAEAGMCLAQGRWAACRFPWKGHTSCHSATLPSRGLHHLLPGHMVLPDPQKRAQHPRAGPGARSGCGHMEWSSRAVNGSPELSTVCPAASVLGPLSAETLELPGWITLHDSAVRCGPGWVLPDLGRCIHLL